MKGFGFILLLASFACTGKVTITEEEIRPDIFYAEGSYKPFTGKCMVVENDSGPVLEEFTYKSGRLHGKAFIWYRNGQLKCKGSYRDGKLCGVWEFWDRAGNKTLEACFENDELNGLFTALTADGQIQEKGMYTANRRTGNWTNKINSSDLSH
jgi:antitoxin component YwqK of YwqJK toxin-antitoxin module